VKILSMTALPPSLRQRSDIESIREDIAPYRGMSAEQRAQVVSELCRWARDAIAASPAPEKAWSWQDRRSPESLELWRRLMREPRRR
jgi:hypothetical protein